MENNARLKIKVGVHEFEAEGPADVVQSQFEAFKDLITFLPNDPQPYPHIDTRQAENPATIPSSRQDSASPDAALGKIMKIDNRVISLTVRPGSAEAAVLLVLYGQKILRENDSVTGSEIIEGLSATGGLQVPRVDRLLEKSGKDGDVIVIGERRAKRYRLTNTGIAKARQFAADMIAIVA